MNHLEFIFWIIALILATPILWMSWKAIRPQRHRIVNTKTGQKAVITKEVKEAMVQEYMLIQDKKSKFSRQKRDKIVQTVEHLVSTGEIKLPKQATNV